MLPHLLPPRREDDGADGEGEDREFYAKRKAGGRFAKTVSLDTGVCFREVFAHFDTDGDGIISAQDIHEVLEGMNEQHCELREVEKMLLEMGVKPDEPMNYAHFCQIMGSCESHVIKSEDFLKYFEAFDPDGSGYITTAEMLHVLSFWGLIMDDNEMDSFMKEYDLDGNGTISEQEFKHMLETVGYVIVNEAIDEKDKDSLDDKPMSDQAPEYAVNSAEPELQPKDSNDDDMKECTTSNLIKLDSPQLLDIFKDFVQDGDSVPEEVLRRGAELLQQDTEGRLGLHWKPGKQQVGLGQVIKKVNHIAIIVSDVGRSAAFYSNVLGFQQIRRPDFDRHGAWFTMGNIELHLIKGVPVVHSGADLIVGHISIETDHIDEVPKILKKLGVPFRQNVSVPKGKQKQGTGTNDSNKSDGIVKQYFLRDPDGYYLEICNCEVLTKYCIGKKVDLSCYEENTLHLSANQAMICACISVKLARHAVKTSEKFRESMLTKYKDLQGKPHKVIAERLRCIPADEVDKDLLNRMKVRLGVYGDPLQNETFESLSEILKLAGNKKTTVMSIIQIHAGDTTILRPPAFYEEGDLKYVPQAFEVKKVYHGEGAKSLEKMATKHGYPGSINDDNETAAL